MLYEHTTFTMQGWAIYMRVHTNTCIHTHAYSTHVQRGNGPIIDAQNEAAHADIMNDSYAHADM